MDTLTSTATKTVSGTKLFIATMAMLGAGGVALATVPLNSNSAYGWSGCVDSDNVNMGYGPTNPFDQKQLFIKGYTKYNSGSKADYCYTFPTTKKTYLMEGVCKDGKFSTWQKNCAELNAGKPENNYQCVDGACVGTSIQTIYLNITKVNLGSSLLEKSTESPIAKYVFTTNGVVKINSLKFNFNPYPIVSNALPGNWKLKVGNLTLADGTFYGGEIIFKDLNLIFSSSSTDSNFTVVANTVGITATNVSIRLNLESVSAVNNVTGEPISVKGLPLIGDTLQI